MEIFINQVSGEASARKPFSFTIARAKTSCMASSAALGSRKMKRQRPYTALPYFTYNDCSHARPVDLPPSMTWSAGRMVRVYNDAYSGVAKAQIEAAP